MGMIQNVPEQPASIIQSDNDLKPCLFPTFLFPLVLISLRPDLADMSHPRLLSQLLVLLCQCKPNVGISEGRAQAFLFPTPCFTHTSAWIGGEFCFHLSISHWTSPVAKQSFISTILFICQESPAEGRILLCHTLLQTSKRHFGQSLNGQEWQNKKRREKGASRHWRLNSLISQRSG